MHPTFVKVGHAPGTPDSYLRYLPSHSWAVSNTACKDASNDLAWAFSVEKRLRRPQEVQDWKVAVGPGKIVVQPSVYVAAVTAEVRASFCTRVWLYA